MVLDDNRLYRKTEPPPPPAPKAAPKKNSKKARAAVRASKRRKVTMADSEDVEDEQEEPEEVNADASAEMDNGLGGVKFECLAVTLEQLRDFLSSIQKSRDSNEKTLYKRITDDLLPILEREEESRKRKQEKRERELLALEKLASAKRSSRIAGRQEQQKQEEEAREEERKRQAALAQEKKQAEIRKKLEAERDNRLQTREQRLAEREARRIQQQADLERLSEEAKKIESGEGRLSERHLKAEMERKKAELEQLELEEDWVFDCVCGVYGQVDDGSHSVACEKCNVWQHTNCVGLTEEEASKPDFVFLCQTCINREKAAEAARKKKIKDEEEARKKKLKDEEDARRRKARQEAQRARELEEAKNQPPSGIKIKLSRPGSSSSSLPPTPHQNGTSPANAHPQYTSPKSSPGVQYSPVKQAYGSPYAYGGQHPPQPNMAPFAYGAQSHTYRPSGSPPNNASINLPPPTSTTNLPPPVKHDQAFQNGAAPQSAYQHQYQTPAAAYYNNRPAPQATPSSGPNGHSNQYNGQQRKVSTGFPSPETGAPVLKPASYRPTTTPQMGHFSPPAPRINPSPSQIFSTPAPQSQAYQSTDPRQSPALPPSTTGLSPTKRPSPPRPTTANGLNATPHSIPPVASLSPSPSQQDPTPPVKHYTAPAPSLPMTASSPSPAILQNVAKVNGSPPIKPATLPPPTVPAVPEMSPVKPPSPAQALPTKGLSGGPVIVSPDAGQIGGASGAGEGNGVKHESSS